MSWMRSGTWVSFWGISYLLLHSESPYDIKKTIQISDLNFSLIKSSLSLSALHPVKASYSGKYLCMCIHVWVHIDNIYINSDSKHCQLISPSYIGTALLSSCDIFHRESTFRTKKWSPAIRKKPSCMAITFRGMHFLPPGANSLF